MHRGGWVLKRNQGYGGWWAVTWLWTLKPGRVACQGFTHQTLRNIENLTRKHIGKWDLDMGEVWWSCWAQQNHQENGQDQILLESLGWMEFPKGPTPKDSNGWSRMYKDVQRINGNNGNSIEATADVGLYIYIDMIWLDMIRGYVLSLSPVYVFRSWNRSWNWAWPN